MYIQQITYSDYFSLRTLASKAWAKSFRDDIRIKLGHFGAVEGNNCAIDASVIILSGRELQRNTVIQAGTVVGKKLSSEEICLGKAERALEFTPTANNM